MATRCNVLIKQKNQVYYVYHHNDGYPDGVGKELREEIIPGYIKEHKGIIYMGAALYDYIYDYCDGYEETDSIHGDIEYLYILTVVGQDNIKYECYKVPIEGINSLDCLNNCELLETFMFNESNIDMKDDKDDKEDTLNEQIENINDVFTEEYKKDRDAFINVVVESNYKSNMTKEEIKALLRLSYAYSTIYNNNKTK